jgi:hypothetical protein
MRSGCGKDVKGEKIAAKRPAVVGSRHNYGGEDGAIRQPPDELVRWVGVTEVDSSGRSGPSGLKWTGSWSTS